MPPPTEDRLRRRAGYQHVEADDYDAIQRGDASEGRPLIHEDDEEQAVGSLPSPAQKQDVEYGGWHDLLWSFLSSGLLTVKSILKMRESLLISESDSSRPISSP
jgi:hypothetical protein